MITGYIVSVKVSLTKQEAAKLNLAYATNASNLRYTLAKKSK